MSKCNTVGSCAERLDLVWKMFESNNRGLKWSPEAESIFDREMQDCTHAMLNVIVPYCESIRDSTSVVDQEEFKMLLRVCDRYTHMNNKMLLIAERKVYKIKKSIFSATTAFMTLNMADEGAALLKKSIPAPPKTQIKTGGGETEKKIRKKKETRIQNKS